jgi:hypothetical protein
MKERHKGIPANWGGFRLGIPSLWNEATAKWSHFAGIDSALNVPGLGKFGHTIMEQHSGTEILGIALWKEIPERKFRE